MSPHCRVSNQLTPSDNILFDSQPIRTRILYGLTRGGKDEIRTHTTEILSLLTLPIGLLSHKYEYKK